MTRKERQFNHFNSEMVDTINELYDELIELDTITPALLHDKLRDLKKDLRLIAGEMLEVK